MEDKCPKHSSPQILKQIKMNKDIHIVDSNIESKDGRRGPLETRK